MAIATLARCTFEPDLQRLLWASMTLRVDRRPGTTRM